jgi:hypothetical protein
VLRACRVGEVRVAKKIDELMEGGSERTQLGATELAAKCLGMTQDQVHPSEGVTVIIQAIEGPQQINVVPPSQAPLQEQPAYNHPKPRKPGEPVQITK